MKFDARRNFLPVFLTAAVAFGCQSLPFMARPQPDPVTQAAPPVSQLASPDETHTSQWEAGRAIYLGECASCHKPKAIQEFAIDEWQGKLIPTMSLKAKLSPDKTQSLAAYIMAVKRMQLVGTGHAKPVPAIAPISAADNR